LEKKTAGKASGDADKKEDPDGLGDRQGEREGGRCESRRRAPSSTRKEALSPFCAETSLAWGRKKRSSSKEKGGKLGSGAREGGKIFSARQV